MSVIKTQAMKFLKDEAGASFLEYTVLLGIILVVSIATITAVGQWASDQWEALDSSLADAGTGAGGS